MLRMTTTPANVPSQEATAPPRRPPRFRWLLRLTLLGLAYAFALVGVRLWWAQEAARRFEAAVAARQARGERVLLTDFTIDRVADDRNAALLYQQASADLVRPDETDAIKAADGRFEFELLWTDRPRLVRTIQDNAGPLELYLAARTRERSDWGIRPVSPVINILLPNLAQQRELAKLAGVAAILAHEGAATYALDARRVTPVNDQRAVDLLNAMVHQAEQITSTTAVLIQVLIRVATDGLTVRVVERIAPSLRVTAAGGEGAAARADVVALIARLFRDADLRTATECAMEWERLMLTDSAPLMWSANSGVVFAPGGPLPTAGPLRVITKTLFGPLAEIEPVRGYPMYDAFIAAAKEDNLPAVHARLLPFPALGIAPNRTSAILIQIVTPSVERAFELIFRGITDRRMAAIALAIRLYELDHGHRPATLADLLPEYLPGPPIDPFRSDGAWIGYLPGGDPPRLYSVGEDGVDDDGSFMLDPGSTYDDRDSRDRLFFLDGPPDLAAQRAVAEEQLERERSRWRSEWGAVDNAAPDTQPAASQPAPTESADPNSP